MFIKYIHGASSCKVMIRDYYPKPPYVTLIPNNHLVSIISNYL